MLMHWFRRSRSYFKTCLHPRPCTAMPQRSTCSFRGVNASFRVGVWPYCSVHSLSLLGGYPMSLQVLLVTGCGALRRWRLFLSSKPLITEPRGEATLLEYCCHFLTAPLRNSPRMEPQDIDALQVSQAEWRRVYCEDPHTSFPMIDDLMSRLAISYRDLLKNPGILLQKLEGGQSLGLNYRELARKPGRCTSFAIKVAMNLEAKHPATFRFQYFHLG